MTVHGCMRSSIARARTIPNDDDDDDDGSLCSIEWRRLTSCWFKSRKQSRFQLKWMRVRMSGIRGWFKAAFLCLHSMR